MDPPAAVETLLASDLLAIEDDRVVVTDAFRSRARAHGGELDDADLAARAAEVLGVSIPTDVGASTLRRFLATAMTIRDAVETDEPALRRMTTVVDQLRPSPPPVSGVPEPFLPVHGERLALLCRLHAKAVVYVWREECPPCDLVREDFEALFETPPDDLSLFAAYGPDSPDALEARYDVVGAPTTLFVIDGRVEMRLQGAYPTETLATAIDSYTETDAVAD